MDDYTDPAALNIVDPELKAHITNLVSALGGPDLTDVARTYVLGDDALGCLRDIKKWIRGYDERMNRWDIARAISETSLVTFDLLEILTKYEEACAKGQNTAMQDRIALACLELLVPLTWPLELDAQSTNNHIRHAPYLLSARLKYKRAILNHPKGVVLRAVIRLAIPVLRMHKTDRQMRDESILKLVIYFFRNILAIEPTTDTIQRTEDDASRSNTLICFDNQKVIAFLITMSAQVGFNLQLQDTALMECAFYIVRGLKASLLFETPKEMVDEVAAQEAEFTKRPTDLKSVLAQEVEMQKNLRRNMSSRHSRFGTMVSLVTEEGKRYAITGQDGLLDEAASLKKLDDRKNWNKPLRKKEQGEAWNQEVPLAEEAVKIARYFVGEFIDAGFNPVVDSLRKLVENDSDRVTMENRMQLLYLVGFMLECERRRADIVNMEKNNTFEDAFDPGLIANALTQNMFIVVTKLMRECAEKGPGQNLSVVYASMVCFVEIMRVVQRLDKSSNEDDRDVALNMKQRLFYEETSLMTLASLPKIALRQSQEFLNKSIELTAVLIKMLESFSKSHTALYVRSKRRRSSKKQKERDPKLDMTWDEEDNDDDVYGGVDPEEESRQVTSDRKFEFVRFEAKYYNIETFDAYKRYLGLFREMNSTQIMSGLWFLHRLFSRKEHRAQFFSLDFMRLLQKMTDRKEGIPKIYKCRREVDRFMGYYVSKLRKALSQTPSLYVELLFDKLPEHVFYLENGYDEAKVVKGPKVAITWEFKTDFELTNEQKHGIAIATLIDEDKQELVEWITSWLEEVVTERTDGKREDKKLTGTVEQILPTKRDGKFRLLLQLLGFTLAENMNADTKLPWTTQLDQIKQGLVYLKKYLFEPFTIEDRPADTAIDFLHRQKPQTAQRKKKSEEDQNDEDENSGIDSQSDVEQSKNSADEDSEPIRKESHKRKRMPKSDSSKPKKKKRAARAGGTIRKPAAPAPVITRSYKSKDFIDSEDDISDEERDREFFENERLLRERLINSMGMKDLVPEKLSKAVSAPPPDDDAVPENEGLFFSDIDSEVEGTQSMNSQSGNATPAHSDDNDEMIK